MAEPSYEEFKSRVGELEKQAAGRRSGELEFGVGEKGGASVYGLEEREKGFLVRPCATSGFSN
jgi:hypothetical protein